MLSQNIHKRKEWTFVSSEESFVACCLYSAMWISNDSFNSSRDLQQTFAHSLTTFRAMWLYVIIHSHFSLRKYLFVFSIINPIGSEMDTAVAFGWHHWIHFHGAEMVQSYRWTFALFSSEATAQVQWTSSFFLDCQVGPLEEIIILESNKSYEILRTQQGRSKYRKNRLQ